MKKDGVDVRGNILHLQCGEDPAFGNFMSGGFIVSDQPVTLNRILPAFFQLRRLAFSDRTYVAACFVQSSTFYQHVQRVLID